ncbi:unnamed protein product [Dovyalis caffra]|uniref:C2H2-type domain-containing protein n=1 Tax=Dovyalis caffra TaxID=77055 RepID=A0AAV1QSW7_9ROSI|nr:unnamed protein product [Dovyalis caffra]
MSRSCDVCNKVFPNGKSWGGHIRACYKKKRKEKDQEDIEDGMEYFCASSESELKFEFHVGDGGGDDGGESSTKGYVEPINLMEHLPQGWSTNSKRRRDSTQDMPIPAALNQASETSCTDEILKIAALKLVLLPRVSDSKKKGIGEELTTYRDKLAHHLGVNKKPTKNNAHTKEKRPSEFVEAHKKTYVCRECGLVFDNFQGLGGHLAAHNRKRLRETDAELDLMDAARQDSKDSPARKEYKCNLCEKSFPSGQALGGHKSYHSSGSAGYNRPRKALGEHKSHHNTPHTELNHSGQALGGHKRHGSAVHAGYDHSEQGYQSHNSTDNAGYNHCASSRETSSGVVSHSHPPSSVEISHPDPPLGCVLDLNMVPDEGLWGS